MPELFFGFCSISSIGRGPPGCPRFRWAYILPRRWLAEGLAGCASLLVHPNPLFAFRQSQPANFPPNLRNRGTNMPQEQNPKKSQNMRLDEEETITTGEAITLEEGMHRGIVKAAYGEQTPQNYRYFQLEIQPETEPEITLRYGCALPEEGRNVTPASKLGKLLMAFGLEVGPGKSYSIRDMKNAIEGKEVRFATLNEEVRDANNRVKGTFANITDGSIKPAKPKA